MQLFWNYYLSPNERKSFVSSNCSGAHRLLRILINAFGWLILRWQQLKRELVLRSDIVSFNWINKVVSRSNRFYLFSPSSVYLSRTFIIKGTFDGFDRVVSPVVAFAFVQINLFHLLWFPEGKENGFLFVVIYLYFNAKGFSCLTWRLQTDPFFGGFLRSFPVSGIARTLDTGGWSKYSSRP